MWIIKSLKDQNIFNMKNRKLNITAAILLVILFNNITLNAQDEIIRDSKGTVIPKNLLSKISIDFKNTPLSRAISIISEKGNLRLNYSEKIFPEEKKITLKLNNVYGLTALRKVLENTGIDFVLTKNDQIVLVKIENKENDDKIKKNVIDTSVEDKICCVNLKCENTNEPVYSHLLSRKPIFGFEFEL